ncbi:MAG: rhomboid family intramembrane serine protease [Dehalococcoidia bacterium]|nr:rhomboid family intramembrane serine protease [Dehalococcoidia bacterium]MDH5781791.1 rhomboid family intramembrane serine protease [Dehalococcoidia bacterium]
MRSYRTFNLNAIWFLIIANVLIFIVTLVRPDAIYLLGLAPANFLDQPWTIITNLFIHGGFGHILFNMISLYFLGSFLFRLVGERKFLITYFLGGIAGNILFILLASPFSIGIGASGAIFALGGALVIMAPRIPVFIFFIPVPVPLWAAMALFLIISFFFRGIAWQAHLGGLILGLVAGYFFKKKRQAFYS